MNSHAELWVSTLMCCKVHPQQYNDIYCRARKAVNSDDIPISRIKVIKFNKLCVFILVLYFLVVLLPLLLLLLLLLLMIFWESSFLSLHKFVSLKVERLKRWGRIQNIYKLYSHHDPPHLKQATWSTKQKSNETLNFFTTLIDLSN